MCIFTKFYGKYSLFIIDSFILLCIDTVDARSKTSDALGVGGSDYSVMSQLDDRVSVVLH